jgi:hypothetical protein
MHLEQRTRPAVPDLEQLIGSGAGAHLEQRTGSATPHVETLPGSRPQPADIIPGPGGGRRRR